jgi:hypothetical protein
VDSFSLALSVQVTGMKEWRLVITQGLEEDGYGYLKLAFTH